MALGIFYSNPLLPAVYTLDSDPTTFTGWGGTNAEANSILYRTDVPTIYRKSSGLATGWSVQSASLDYVDVKSFGAQGNGTTNDIDAIEAAIAVAAAFTAGGTAYGGYVFFPKGTYMVSRSVLVPNGVGLRGDGTPTTLIKALPAFSDTALVQNTIQTGNQEFMFLESMSFDGNQANGAVCSVAVVNMVSLFINSYIRDCEIFNGSNNGLRIAAAGAPGAGGPILVENVWCINNLGHGFFGEEVAGNAGAFVGICVINLTSEHQGAGKSAIYLKGIGNAAQWCFYNTHIEQGGAAINRRGITCDGIAFAMFDGGQILWGGSAGQVGIEITNVVQNVSLQFRNFFNPNLINPFLSDLKNGNTVAAINLPYYATPDVVVTGGMRFRAGAVGNIGWAIQNSAGTDKLWALGNGQLTGSSPSGAAVEILADATNNRPLILVQNAGGAVAYGFVFPGANTLRFRNFTGGVDIFQADTSGNITFYNSIIGTGTNAAAPAVGAHVRGEIVFNGDPVAAGFIGWVCVASGTPGTWKSWGVISA